MATSNAARGKIRLAAINGEKIPNDWALDKNGQPTTDPMEALKGSMIPIGGYKGYGLSLVVDVLAGLLTCSSFGGDVKSLNHSDSFSRNGHLIIVINISFFQEVSTFINKMDYLTENVKACGDEQMIFLPGEKKYNFQMNSKGIVDVSDKQVENINSLTNQLGLNCIISSTP
jgi:L-2-hydroxycarboxylate dehydrogenase (NAD+)